MSSPALQLRHVGSNPTFTVSTSPSTASAVASPPVPDASHLSPHPTPSSQRTAPPQPLVTTSHQGSIASRKTASRPSSIPSSPTSVHSSSSAIFERDIEPLTFHSSPSKSDPHHTSRAQAHEPTEASVPAVLTSAISALSLSPTGSIMSNSPPHSHSPPTHSQSIDDAISEISVIAPNPGTDRSSPLGVILGSAGSGATGVASPKTMSRSPSPSAGRPVGGSPPTRPLVFERQSTGPLPPGAFPHSSPEPLIAPSKKQSSGDTGRASLEQHSPPARLRSADFGVPITDDGMSGATGPSASAKRLSFVSYHDLLTAIPTTSTPLSSLTSPPSDVPPPHLASLTPLADTLAHATSVESLSRSRGRSGYAGNPARDVGWGKEDGGEWEREGLGKGLEERLEEVINLEEIERATTQTTSGVPKA